MAENITDRSFPAVELHGEGVGLVISFCRHWQADHGSRAVVELLRGQHHRRKGISYDAWFRREISQAVREAYAGDFATDEEVGRVLDRRP